MEPDKIHIILIIDDDPTLLLLAEKKLTQHGYHVLTAGTGEEGIQCALEKNPDLLLLDYELPDMTGVDVCRKLRNHTVRNDKPILFVAGKEDYQSIENAFQAGATDFSRKPLNWTILLYRIKYLLRAHEINLSLLSSEKRLTKAQKIAKIANWDYNLIDESFKWSNTIYDILEMNLQARRGFALQDFLGHVPTEDAEAVRQAIVGCVNNNVSFELEHEVITDEGSKKIISHIGNVIKNDADEVVDCIGTLQDITERRNTESQVRTLAYFDSLTGLMNRESFLMVLDKILASNKQYKLLSALLFIDLDDFKRVNDSLGHNFGDLLLCDIAERLKNCVRTAEQDKKYQTNNHRLIKNIVSDRVIRASSIEINRFDLSRLGGDEFTVFLADIPNEEVAASIAKRLLKALEKPFNLDGHEVYVTFSIGIAISPNDGESIQTLLKNADTAMYNAKANGKNNFQYYTKAMNERSLYRLTLESDLRNAIARNELHLNYQPQICLQTGRLIGAEALMRWKHKTKGNISPVEFIPLAEETGQILVIGDWLFDQFRLHLHGWKRDGLIPEEFKLALNISSLQFQQSNILDKVGSLFPDLELNKHVEFELTESVMMNNAATNLTKLKSLAEKNITLSIDDFGTGYSSLSYLHRFPVHTVKIDRSFVSNMENDGQVNIVKAIIAMAHGMNIKVVAEGIENQWQYDFLAAEGCDIGQGFFLHKPMSTDQFEQLLKKSCLTTS
jgi:predicted signal transduction protein with EAL and GGDEF domain/DNA-binding response OmpR family regulator